MCLNVFSFNDHPKYKLIIAANRDEFYARKTAVAAYWKNDPNLLAGKDLEQGGTWLGITRTGRFSFITNYRDPKTFKANAPSRGALVSNYLTGTPSAEEYLKSLDNIEQYNGFNLVAGDLNEVWYCSNISGEIKQIENGMHALSNAFLDTPWKKTVAAKDALKTVTAIENFSAEELLAMLQNDEKAADSELPSTGVPYEIEKLISSIFIKSETYGTVCSTVILIDNTNNVQFYEKTTNPLKENKTVVFDFKVEERVTSK